MNSDTADESAKATQEVAKTIGKAIEASRGLGGWLDKIFGKAVEHSVGALWTDRVSERRIAASIYSWERLELLLHKTEQRLRKKGVVNFRVPPPKVMLPLLENATMENDDHLHTLWAQLLATSLDEKSGEVHRKYVSILGDLTSEDTSTLDELWREWRTADKTKETHDSTLTYGPGIDGTHSYNEASIITINRLGLISSAYTKIKTYEPGGHNRYGDYGPYQEEIKIYGDLSSVVFTPLGEAFCEAVIPTADR